MTLIEFCDNTAIENICACLMYDPERVYLIGHRESQLLPLKERYIGILSGWNKHPDFQCVSVRRNSLRQAVEKITQIVKDHDDCVFGLTGGEDLYLTALGIVKGMYPDRNIRLHRFNIEEGKVLEFSDQYAVEETKQVPVLSVQENVRIYGGDVIFGEVTDSVTYEWDVTDQLAMDVQAMWNICKKQNWDWNAQIGTFAALIECGQFSDGGQTVSARISAIQQTLRKNDRSAQYEYNPVIIEALKEIGMLTQCFEENGQLTVGFKDLQIRRCLSAAGRVLELRVYLAALDLKENEEYVYDDVINGAFIDWDGQQYDEQTQRIYDTENEIDIFLMRGMIPVFISCKNGKVTMEELYKLSSVAHRFGGKYAKTVLVATHIPKNESGNYLRQRAADMDIRIIEDVQHASDEQLQRELKKCWRKLTDQEKALAVAQPAYT